MKRFFIPNEFLYHLYPDVEIDIPIMKFIWDKKEYTFINCEATILYNGYYGYSLDKKLPHKLLKFVKEVEETDK